jgi:single-strand DNA-binding protein
MSRSLNKAQLIGNLTRDAELRYTPNGTAVANLSIATNRQWKDSQGNEQDQATFHRVVAWGKLAEICGQYLHKGDKVFVEGRIDNRKYTTQAGEDKYISEIVIDEMMMLGGKGGNPNDGGSQQYDPDDSPPEPDPDPEPETEPEPPAEPPVEDGQDEEEQVNLDDIPF